MDPEEHQHDTPADPSGDRAQAADTIATASTGPDESWRQTSGPDDPGGEMWRKGPQAAWAPEADQTQEQKWATEGIPAGPNTMAPGGVAATVVMPHLAAGRSTVPQPLVSQHRQVCEHCGGAGFMPSISDHLRESVALLGDQGDEVIRSFYRRLFTAAPEVAKLFPGNPTEGDLGTDHRGARQREKLLGAIVALADLYDPDDPAKMERLDNALLSFGRSHAAFARGDGTVKGATWEEYAAVKDALFATLVSATGNAWKPEYAASWGQAYDYAAAVMLAEQHRSGFALPRFPRQ